MKNLAATIILSIILLISVDVFAMAKKTQKCDINIKNRQFTSGNLENVGGKKCKFQLEAGKRHQLVICNLDKTPAEFESHDLRIEKIIKGESSVKVRLKPLTKGKNYIFEEEFSETHCSLEAI